MRLLAPAKLNLALHVTGQRADGYHLLDSLVAFAMIGDAITILPAAADRLTCDGPFGADVPALESNIIGRALSMVRRWGVDEAAKQHLHIHLTKDLPVASGLGGGSADAAALIALLTHGRALSPVQLSHCLAIGADVLMCLAGKPALVGGIGETITPVDLPEVHLVLVNPLVGVSTPAVFAGLQHRHNPPLPPWTQPQTFDSLINWLGQTRNDLREPAMSLAPQIGQCLAALKLMAFAGMSGSGSSCFGLCQTFDEAEDMAERLQRVHPGWWVRSAMLPGR